MIDFHLYWACQATRQAVEEMEATNYLTLQSGDTATKASVVNIAAADDPDYDYYFMKVRAKRVFLCQRK